MFRYNFYGLVLMLIFPVVLLSQEVEILKLNTEHFPKIIVTAKDGSQYQGVLCANENIVSGFESRIKQFLKISTIVQILNVETGKEFIFFTTMSQSGYSFSAYAELSRSGWGEYCLNMFFLQRGWVELSKRALDLKDLTLGKRGLVPNAIKKMKENNLEVPHLNKILKNESATVAQKSRAMEKLRRVGYHGKSAIPELLRLLDNEKLQKVSLDTLSYIGNLQPNVIKKMCSCFDTSPYYTISSFLELGFIPKTLRPKLLERTVALANSKIDSDKEINNLSFMISALLHLKNENGKVLSTLRKIYLFPNVSASLKYEIKKAIQSISKRNDSEEPE